VSGKRPRSIALVEPLGDIGIGGYTYELAEALAGAGHDVTVYTLPSSPWRDRPRRHALRPVLATMDESAAAPMRWLERRRATARLVLEFRSRRYDLVWTQWPLMLANTFFWRYGRLARLPLVHTVHNVLPHEHAPGDRERLAPVYDASRALIVHSEYARRALEATYPSTTGRIIVEPLGAYTSYPSPSADRSVLRSQLKLPPESVIVLAFGWVRPFKNVEGMIRALSHLASEKVVLVIAGRESGYAEPSPEPGDPLARMRAVARDAGVIDRVRFLPGFLDEASTADLMSAVDIVGLPYLESWGSAQLLLAMTFGRYVLATAVGGMDEHLADYPAHTILAGTTAADIAWGIEGAMARLPTLGAVERRIPPALEWARIAPETIAKLEPLMER
jgi:glycosyltransferase involved in cell wall biosynthesis